MLWDKRKSLLQSNQKSVCRARRERDTRDDRRLTTSSFSLLEEMLVDCRSKASGLAAALS
jgi:hypothetical protein